MKYMFLAYESAADFAARTSKDGPAYREGWMAYGAALREAGAFVAGAGLLSADRGATLRAPDGKRAVQDGPYADTKERLGGYYVDRGALARRGHRARIEEPGREERRAGGAAGARRR